MLEAAKGHHSGSPIRSEGCSIETYRGVCCKRTAGYMHAIARK